MLCAVHLASLIADGGEQQLVLLWWRKQVCGGVQCGETGSGTMRLSQNTDLALLASTTENKTTTGIICECEQSVSTQGIETFP